MPFRDNPYFTPLYDTLRGGSPRAWECHLPIKIIVENNIGQSIECGKITKSLDGMYQHLFRVHNYKPQAEVDFTPRVLPKEVNSVENIPSESERENSD